MMACRVFHCFRVKELLLRNNFPILHRIIAGGRGLTGMQITVGGGGREGYAKKLINATVVLLFKLSGAFLGKLMCLQGDCRPDGKREPTFPLPAPALGQVTGSPAQLGLGTSTQTPPCPRTRCAELQYLPASDAWGCCMLRRGDGRSAAKAPCSASVRVSEGRDSPACPSLLGLTVIPDPLGCTETSCHAAATLHAGSCRLAVICQWPAPGSNAG